LAISIIPSFQFKNAQTQRSGFIVRLSAASVRYIPRSSLVAGLLLAGNISCAAPISEKFVSPAIDRNIFRESEVKRFGGEFGAWRFVCDEIPKLKKRSCSLFGLGRDADGRILLEIVFSTNDEGQPAAVARIPAEVSRSRDIEVFMSPLEPKQKDVARRKKERPIATTRLRVVSCESSGCLTLWAVTPDQIAGLSSGGSLHVRYFVSKNTADGAPVKKHSEAVAVDLAIDGSGFADAVKASMASSP
jgi:hypothetical protein